MIFTGCPSRMAFFLPHFREVATIYSSSYHVVFFVWFDVIFAVLTPVLKRNRKQIVSKIYTLKMRMSSPGSEPDELPLLYPAISFHSHYRRIARRSL